MNYFRRASLAGQNLPLQNVPSIRGNVRRHNADATSALPYFAGLTAGQTLDITSHAGSALVALTSNTLSGVLTELNTGLSTIGVTAYDDDGCVGLKTIAGGTAFVRVNGGTGSVALGFDTQAQRFVSYGGSVPGSSEGRRGVWFGTKFPNRGENLTVESFNKAIAAVAGNADILYAEFMRTEVEFQKVVSNRVAPTNATTSYVDLPASQEVFLGALSAGASTLDISRFFFLTNGASAGSLSHCKVSGITDTGGQNLIGLPSQVLLLNRAITSIPNSSTVYVSTFDFVGAGVTTSCYAQIAGATNTTPTNNNGYWAIEEVQAHHLKLRPLSRSEATLLGVAAPAAGAQPVLELNYQGSGFGNLTITRGPWATGVRLQLSPQLPHGYTYSVWAAVPVSRRTRELTQGANPYFSSAAAAALSRSTFDCILTVPSVTVTASDIQVGTFSVRWSSQPVAMPAAVLSRAAGVTNYVYWNSTNCTLAAQTAASASGTMQPIASVAADGTVAMMCRLESDGDWPITVGSASSQFTGLTEALAYARHLVTSGRAARSVIQLTNQTVAMGSNYTIDFPVSIRGAPNTTLTRAAAYSFVVSTGIQFDLRDVYTSDSVNPLVTGDLAGVTYSNVRQGNITQLSAGLSHTLGLDETYNKVSLDTPASHFLRLGEHSNGVMLGRVGLPNEVVGPLIVDTRLDANAPLNIGTSSAASVIIGRSGISTTLNGTSVQLAPGNRLDAVALSLGTVNAATIAMGSAAAQTVDITGTVVRLTGATSVIGDLDVSNELTTPRIDSNGVLLSIGANVNTTSIGHVGGTTAIYGNFDVSAAWTTVSGGTGWAVGYLGYKKFGPLVQWVIYMTAQATADRNGLFTIPANVFPTRAHYELLVWTSAGVGAAMSPYALVILADGSRRVASPTPQALATGDIIRGSFFYTLDT